MPPKKKTGDDGAEAGGDGKFRWTAENERTLLLLAMNRGTLTKDDYHKMVGAFPGPGTNWDAIRQRFIKMRKEQRALCEQLDWPLPCDAEKTPSKTPGKSPKKRGAADKGEEGGDGAGGDAGVAGEMESPAKKPRARKPKKEVVQKEVQEDDGLGGELFRELNGDDGFVKEELVEEDV
ncbi:hypothetical protein J4E93_008205 [Alternaria ventricosa]|uniref:uncharacterized protein n=1 Tax=Alternaria ventricosa TaxID=1187951 RepID=UPI0020C4C475|nr:uncharacterized protein J4E93_008205 [Alternaria ventricosa]KAI4640615.1 hypothetical protein J4E93_008205 [Alternaria ventricosa]